VRAAVGRLTWKVLLYLVVAVLLCGLTRDRMLTGLLTAGFVVGDRGVAALLRTTMAGGGRRRRGAGPPAEAGVPPARSSQHAARRWP